MAELQTQIMASIKAHKVAWLGGAGAAALFFVWYARTHPMKPLPAMKTPAPTTKHPTNSGNANPFLEDGSHNAYESGVDNRVAGGVGPWLPQNEDLRSN